MNAHISNDSHESEENLIMDDMDEDFSKEEISQTRTQIQQINISARRRIEEYLEKKHLASQTMDYFFSE